MRTFWEHFGGRNNNHTNSKWTFFDTECTIQNTVNFGANNGYCVQPRFVGGERTINTNQFPAYSDGILAFHCRFDSVTATGYFIGFSQGGGFTDISLHFSAGLLQVKRGGTVIATGTFTFVINTNYHLQVRVLTHDSAGIIQTKVNNELDIDASGLDTKNGGGSTIAAFELKNQGTGTNWYCDNIVLQDTDNSDGLGETSWPGVLNCLVETPNGNGTGGVDNEWSKSTGSSAAAVTDDTPANEDTDFIYSTTAGQKQRVTFPSSGLSGGGVGVDSVCFEHVARNVSSGGCKLGTKEGGTTTMESSARSLNSSYGTEEIRYKNNPRTSATYSLSEALGSDAVIEMTV